MKLNKALLTLGTLAAVAAPIATVVSCGDKTPAKEQPPVTPTNAGGQTPGPQTPGPQVPGSAGPSQSKTQTVKLDDGILDYLPQGSFTTEQLNKIFDKFTIDFDFASKTNYQLALTHPSKEVMDHSKKMVKVMITAEPNNNHGSKIFLVGVLGFVEGKNSIYFTYVDFDNENEIKDEPTYAVSENQIDIFNPEVKDKNLLFAFMPNLPMAEILAKLQKLATDNGITTK